MEYILEYLLVPDIYIFYNFRTHRASRSAASRFRRAAASLGVSTARPRFSPRAEGLEGHPQGRNQM
jgi:hypothetical protein